MQTRYYYLLRFTLAWTDIAIVNLCFFIGFYLSNKYGGGIDRHLYQPYVIVCNLIWIICTGIFKLYNESTIHVVEFIYRATWKSIALHVSLFLVYLYLTNSLDFSK